MGPLASLILFQVSLHTGTAITTAAMTVMQAPGIMRNSSQLRLKNPTIFLMNSIITIANIRK